MVFNSKSSCKSEHKQGHVNNELLLFSQDIATMQLCANKLDKKDFFGKSDPFLVFYRSNEDGT